MQPNDEDRQPSARREPPAGRVHVDVRDGAGWIVLDNPAKLNAISEQMWQDMLDTLDRFEIDPTVRCVVVAGHGARAFCAGADISEKHRRLAAPTAQKDQVAFAALAKLQAFPKPTIASIQGYCLGAGANIAIACDLRIGAAGSAYGIPVSRLGIGYFYDGGKRLVAIVGASAAKRILFTADRLPADEALRIGLVDQLVPVDELTAATAALAGRIAANAPLTVSAAKLLVETVLDGSAPDAVAACIARERACLESQDHAEALLAFLEKRPPVFLGR